MVRILHRGFAKSQKPSDLAEEKGSYDKYSPSAAQNKDDSIQSKKGHWITRVISFHGFTC
jgi:hypothetical protein